MFNRIHKSVINLSSRVTRYDKPVDTLHNKLHNKFEEYKTQLDKQTFDTIFDFETNVLLLYYDVKTAGYLNLLNDIIELQTKITEKIQLNKIR